MENMIYPDALKSGDRVAVIAPSSPAGGQGVKEAEQSLRFLGLEPVFYRSCFENIGYLSGSDETRAYDVNQAFSDDSIRGVVCIRGGYGATRLLPLIDFGNIARNPKVFWGYSDITALHTAINNKSGLITFHGTMPTHNYSELDAYTLNHLRACLFGDSEKSECSQTTRVISNPPDYMTEALVGGQAEGRLTGGNLSVMVSAIASPFEVDTENRILLIEDTEEDIYKVDRMLTTLSLAGKLEKCAAFIIGTFTNMRGSDEPFVSVENVIRDIIVPLGKPTLSGFCSGHSYPQAMLPMGAFVRLDSDVGELNVIF